MKNLTNRKIINRFSSVLPFCIALAIFVAPAYAEELWFPHLRGGNEGLAAGSLPPEGVYFINNTYYSDTVWYNDNGNRTKTKIGVFVECPFLLWSTGLNVLGANYGIGLGEPVDWTSLKGGLSNWGLGNTIIQPLILSWKLSDFRVKTILGAYIPDAGTYPGETSLRKGIVQSGNNYWTIEPGVGLSWLHDGWNLSADMRVDCNFENPLTHYISGDVFWADYTATKTMGKWTFGVGGSQENQFVKDVQNPGGNNHLRLGVVDKAATTYNVGPVVGYDFGFVNVMAIYNFDLYNRNIVGGNGIYIRMTIPLKFIL